MSHVATLCTRFCERILPRVYNTWFECRTWLQVARFYSSPGERCRIGVSAPDLSEVHVGRHRVPTTPSEIRTLRKRWTGPASDVQRAASTARLLALYRALENPLTPDGHRGPLQFCLDPEKHKFSGVDYELFASPLNAKVSNGRFASRWPHVEADFGSLGSYPDVLDLIPDDSVVAVHPPFTEAYLDHLMNWSLDSMVSRFRELRLVVPVREAPWRGQLTRLKGASFLRQLWDVAGCQMHSMGQPVLYWAGCELSPA